MKQLNTLIKKEILEFSRSKKLLILLIIFLFIAISSPIIAKLIPNLIKSMPQSGIEIKIPTPTWKDAVDQFIKNISQIALIVIIFVFAGAVTDEKNKKTLELVLTKPVSRKNFILSKFFSSFLILAIIYGISCLIFYLYSNSIFEPINGVKFFNLSLLSLIYLILASSLAIFFSISSTNSIMAAGLTFIVEILFGSILGYIQKISDYLPGYILGNYKDIFTATSISDFLPSMYVSLVLIVGLIIGSIYLFSRQEVER